MRNTTDQPIKINIEGFGECTATRSVVLGEYYQWTIRHPFVQATGDYSFDNGTALRNAIEALRRAKIRQTKRK